MTPEERQANKEKADKFVAAVADGAKVYAHPSTAALMREFLGDIEECQWLEEGTLYAANFGRYTCYANPLGVTHAKDSTSHPRRFLP